MGAQRGKDSHGPGGDPSWLGGKDRDGKGGAGAFHEPEFGRVTGNEATGDPGGDQDGGRSWTSDFASGSAQGGHVQGGDAQGDGAQGSDTGGGEKGLGAQLLGMLTSMIGLVIFAVVAYSMGMSFWWLAFIIGIPLVSRVIRIVRKNFGG